MKQETKSIQINSQIHAELKQCCSAEGLKLQKLVEKLIVDELSKNIRSNNTESEE